MGSSRSATGLREPLVHASDPAVEETIKRRVQPYFVCDGKRLRTARGQGPRQRLPLRRWNRPRTRRASSRPGHDKQDRPHGRVFARVRRSTSPALTAMFQQIVAKQPGRAAGARSRRPPDVGTRYPTTSDCSALILLGRTCPDRRCRRCRRCRPEPPVGRPTRWCSVPPDPLVSVPPDPLGCRCPPDPAGVGAPPTRWCVRCPADPLVSVPVVEVVGVELVVGVGRSASCWSGWSAQVW